MENFLWKINFTRKQERAFFVEPTERAEKLFSSKEKAEEWLIEKGFVFGQCNFFKKQEEGYWFHQNDKVSDHVVVELYKVCIDEKDVVPKWIENLNYRPRNY